MNRRPAPVLAPAPAAAAALLLAALLTSSLAGCTRPSPPATSPTASARPTPPARSTAPTDVATPSANDASRSPAAPTPASSSPPALPLGLLPLEAAAQTADLAPIALPADAAAAWRATSDTLPPGLVRLDVAGFAAPDRAPLLVETDAEATRGTRPAPAPARQFAPAMFAADRAVYFLLNDPARPTAWHFEMR